VLAAAVKVRTTTFDDEMDSSVNEGEPATPESVRKARLIRRVPILAHVVKHGLCPEGELLRSLELVTFSDGEYIYCQGQPERDVLFIEEGKVLITQRRRSRALSSSRPVGFIPMDSSGGVVFARRSTRRRSQIEAEMEIQLHKHEELEYFGEEALLQGLVSRMLNAVASGVVTCFVLPEAAFARLLAPVHEVMLHRHLLRMHGVLAKQRVFQHFSARQRQFLLDRCPLEHYEEGARIIQQGGKDDDRYFILAEGEADVVLDEPLRDLRPKGNAGGSGEYGELHVEAEEDDDNGVRSSVVCRKTVYQGFGEMGILGRPRTAHVVAAGAVLCVTISRKTYIGASQLIGVGGVDTDADALLAMSLMEEWALVVKTRNLHLANPLVSRHLETFVKKFKAAYMQKFEGKTLYLDLLRRMHADSTLADEFPFLSDRVAWDQPTSSLSITRAETRRVLSLPPADRSPFEISFLARLLEPTGFIDKFDRPDHIDKLTLARGIARFAAFATIQKEKFLFRQGKIESRAFLILRGNINIVNEDVSTMQAGLSVKHYDVLATLAAGDSFGELSLVTRLQRSATALAPCEADLVVLERPHLHALMELLPGVSVQHAMVERAEFLATLSFLRDGDFAQCIRVAHDLQEQFYEPRHIFLQEPVHLRTLYIVKRGEVVVFLRRQVPVADSTTIAGTNDSAASKEVLVRVATIGPQEFFGVAITSANMLAPSASVAGAIASTGAPNSPTGPSTGGAPSSPPASSPTSPVAPQSVASAQLYVATTLAAVTSGNGSAPSSTATYDFARTVFMCSTQVQMLELSERGWRRLPMASLQCIRKSLLERHRWNQEAAEKHNQQAYFLVDKPWQAVARPSTSSASSTTKHDGKDPQARVLEPLPVTQLARRIKYKKQQQHQQGHQNAVSRLFSPASLTPTKPCPHSGRLSTPSIYVESPSSTPSSRGSPIYGAGQLRTTSAGLAAFSQGKNWVSSAMSPSFLSPSRTTQLGGSFQPKGAISPHFFNMPSSPKVAVNSHTTRSPRPPAVASSSNGTPSPRQPLREDSSRRRSSPTSKQDTVRNAQTVSEDNCKAIWKLQRRPSTMK
jgi:CRP-like cAMP-binding protein